MITSYNKFLTKLNEQEQADPGLQKSETDLARARKEEKDAVAGKLALSIAGKSGNAELKGRLSSDISANNYSTSFTYLNSIGINDATIEDSYSKNQSEKEVASRFIADALEKEKVKQAQQDKVQQTQQILDQVSTDNKDQ